MPPQYPQNPQITDMDRQAANVLRGMLQAQARLDEMAKPNVPKGHTLVRETPDGGKIYRKPDGQLTFTSSGYATNNQAEIQRMIQGMAPGQARRAETNKQIVEQDGVRGAAASAIKGLPFIGEYFDEAVGAITGDPRTTAALRETTAAYEEQKPLEALGLQMGLGTVATLPLVPFQAVGNALKAAPSMGRAMLGGLGIGAGAGAVEGAVAGFGAGEGSAEQRLPSAQTGAVIGGALGGALGAAAAPIEAGVRSALQNWFKSVPPNVLNDTPKPPPVRMGFGGKSFPMDEARGSLIEADAIGRIASGKTVPTSAELDDALKGLREAEFADLVRQFGGDRQKAEKFKSLWRQAENAPTRQEADMLDAQRQKLIEGMPDVEPREFVDEYALRQLRDAFRDIENGNAVKALNDSMTDLPTMREVQDGKISSRAQAALAILRKATQEARLQGLDPKQMMKSALENYGRRFSDPVDAEFMVGEVKKLFAAFDPSETQSSKLLAGVSGNPEAIGAGLGTVFAPDADGDGEVSFGERAGAAITGALGGRLLRGGDRGAIGGGPQAQGFGGGSVSMRSYAQSTPEELDDWYKSEVEQVAKSSNRTTLRLKSSPETQSGTLRKLNDVHINFENDGVGLAVDMTFRGEHSTAKLTPSRKDVATATRVFAKTLAAIDVYVRKNDPAYITFTGASQAHNRLYQKLMERANFKGYTAIKDVSSSSYMNKNAATGDVIGSTTPRPYERFMLIKDEELAKFRARRPNAISSFAYQTVGPDGAPVVAVSKSYADRTPVR